MLKTGPGVLGGSNWQDMQKMDTLRKVYQRAVSVPHNATLEIWRDYDKFEMSMNKVSVSILIVYLSLPQAYLVTGSQTTTGNFACIHDCSQCYQRS